MQVGSQTVKWRLFWLGVVAPLAAVSVGVDGGDIFQILAVEDLELDPRAVGIALGLGTLSVPIQIWAVRIPLTNARHNLRWFLLSLGVMAIATGLLVAFAPPGSLIAGLALVIAILAEIAVSVLLATAWQPVISYTLTVEQRQFINGQGRAFTGLAMMVSVALFGQFDQTGRALFLAAVGLAAFATAAGLRILPPPPDRPTDDSTDERQRVQTRNAKPDPGGITNLYVTMPATALVGWPLLVTYAGLVLWPDGNLGLLGAALAGGSIAASALWRDPDRRLLLVIRAAAVVVAISTVGLVAIKAPIESTEAVIALLAVVAVGSAARTTMRTGVMELAHRRITTDSSVRVMTMIDVIGSTTSQLGLFVAGFLIAASTSATAGLDPYELWILATTVVLLIAVARLRSRSSDTLSNLVS